MTEDKKIVTLIKPVATQIPPRLRMLPPIKGEQCEACFFFFHNEDGQAGTCRRNPPPVVAIPQMNSMRQPVMTINSINPPVNLDGWCGEFLNHAEEMENIAKEPD